MLKMRELKPKRILFVLEHFHPYIGGAEKLFYQLTTGLVKKGNEVTVLTTRFDDQLPKKEIHQGVKIIRINCSNRFSFTFLSLPKIIQLARKHDIIHTTTYNAALPAVLGGKLMRKKVFVTFHEVWGDLWWRLPFISFGSKVAFWFFEKILLILPFDKYIAVSEFTKNKLIKQGVAARKVTRIYNGVDYDSFTNILKPPQPSHFTFTYFGRLGISKGLDLLIPAVAELKKTTLDFTFKLIIPTVPKPLFDQIMKLIVDHDLHSNIELHHNLPKEILHQELLQSSCVVIPSYSEGFCFAAAESVAMLIPVISSHQGALQEVVSGRFIRMKQMSVDGLTTALKMGYKKQWTDGSINFFHLHDAIFNYLKLYEEFTPLKTPVQE